MKNLLLLIFAIILIVVEVYYSQTIKLGGIEVSIGDSLSEITSRIDTNYYSFTLTKPEKMEQMGYLRTKENPKDESLSSLGIIYFFTPDKYFNRLAQSTVTCVQKIWADQKSNALNLMEKFYALLESYGIDKYDHNVSFMKEVEPDGTSYTIDIKTNLWHTIEFVFDKNGVQLSEVINENAHQFDDKIYYLFFDDYKHYSSKTSNVIVEKFKDEKKAEERKRMLELPYILENNTPANSQIIRVWRSGFNDDKN